MEPPPRHWLSIISYVSDIATGFFEGSYGAVASKLKVSSDTIKKTWKAFCTSGESKWPKSCASGAKQLKPEDLEFIEVLKTDKPSMTSGEILKEVKQHCFIPGGTSKETINTAVRNFTDARRKMVVEKNGWTCR